MLLRSAGRISRRTLGSHCKCQQQKAHALLSGQARTEPAVWKACLMQDEALLREGLVVRRRSSAFLRPSSAAYGLS